MHAVRAVQDTGSVRRVVGTLLQWLDAGGRWDNALLVQVGGGQKFLNY